jgi:signal transduction histidine kinase/CheY-like chemotaxis protein
MIAPRTSRSFATKVVRSVTLIAGLAVITVSALLLAADHRVRRTEARETLRSQATMVALDSGAPLLFGDSRHASEVLAALRTSPDIAGATLFDLRGELFATYRRAEGELGDPATAASGLVQEGRWLRLSVPVEDRGERQGQLVLVSDLAPLRARLLRGAGFAALVACCAMVFTFLVARRVAAGLTVQIDELVRTATRVTETRDSTLRAARVSDDELGHLALQFNEMLGQIDQQKQELGAAQAEREELLASERAARAEAERASRMKDEFVATLSHELRTPLTPILGWVTILRQIAGKEAQVAQGLDVIERNARLQADLISDLLEMSRIISGKQRLDVQTVDLVEVAQAALATAQPAAVARDIRLVTRFDADAAFLRGDPSRLQQVIWNLVSNAIKFTGRGGAVEVSLRRADSEVEIVVADTGQGISPELLPYVFERFRQGDSSTTRKHGGLGLGLAIVRQLVELHGGSVRAESAGEGRGSVFTVSLPRLPALDTPLDGQGSVRPGTDAPGQAVDEPISLDGLDVLVVDDDDDSRDLLRRLLEHSGASARLVGSAQAALEVYRDAPPQLLISDIGMPEMDGYELIRRVREIDRERGRPTPAIALTAFARTEDRNRALLAGYQMHVAKPVAPAELLAAVATLAGRA